MPLYANIQDYIVTTFGDRIRELQQLIVWPMKKAIV